MSRPKTSLIHKISNATQMPVEALTAERCWPWFGAYAKFVPVMRFEGKTRSVRRVLWEDANGWLDPSIRLRPHCSEPRCVNPHHAAPFAFHDARPSPDIFSAELTVEDLIDLVLGLEERDRTLDRITTLGWDTSSELIQEAIRKITIGEV